jgi:hypothetical protein
LDTVYAVIHKEKKLAYIGRTNRSMLMRWKEHRVAAREGDSSLPVYEAMRHDPDGFEIINCETSKTASEAKWMQTFIDDGYTLLNATGGNTKPLPKRTRKPSVAAEKIVFTEEHHERMRAWLDETMKAAHAKIDWDAMFPRGNVKVEGDRITWQEIHARNEG